jgi:hypothetical protein
LSEKGGEGGTSADYPLRLARDHHEDVLARCERGEFPSVKAAAHEARVGKAPSPFAETKRLLEKHVSSFTASQKAELLEMLVGEVEPRPRPLSR